jgi:hypothetical protein
VKFDELLPHEAAQVERYLGDILDGLL